MKRVCGSLFILFVLFAFYSPVHADPTDINLTIRDGSEIVFSGVVPLPPAGTFDIDDNGGITHTIDADSVLSVVNDADLADASWSISSLTFYSFGAYVKCVNYSGGEECDNWQYAVDGNTPFQSIDQNMLAGGETVYLYFGSPHRVVSGESEVRTGQNFTVTAENYDYTNNTWGPLGGVVLGVTEADPNDSFNPIEISTKAVDGNGQAEFSVATSGSYQLGIKEDFYFPTIPISVINPPTVAGSGHIILPEVVKVFSVSDAMKYLLGQQKVDGSFPSGDMYTDWASIALVAGGADDSVKEKILNYFKGNTAPSSLLTDNERRVTALLALGQNPYSFSGADYVKPILDAFDGVQFGDKDLVNDDIFALISLSHVGYSKEDEIISKDIKFILSKQREDGSWEGSVDLSAAAIQTLKVFEGVEGVTEALAKSKDYISGRQGEDGGWGDVFSTSWAMQAQSVLEVKWERNGKSGIDYLRAAQADSGAVVSGTDESEQNKIWATSYAIPAALGKPWSAIFHTVAKPAPVAIAMFLDVPVKPVAVVKKAGNVKTVITTAAVSSAPAIVDSTPELLEVAQVVRAASGGEENTPLYMAITILVVLSGSLFSFIKFKN